MNKTVYIYDIPECMYVCKKNFDECCKTEDFFFNEINNKCTKTDDICKADFAYIPAFLASFHYSNGRNQELFDNAWKKIKLVSEEIRNKIPHFVVYSYVLINISFECIPKDIKILSYESEVSVIQSNKSHDRLVNNGCHNRIIVIPYILDTQPGYSNTVEQITRHIFHDLTIEESISIFSKRKSSLVFIGSNEHRTHFIKDRENLVLKLKSVFGDDLDIKHPKENITSSYVNAKFALILRGDTPTRKAFYTALSMGCIPIIFEECLLHYSDIFNGSLPIEDVVITIPKYKNTKEYFIQVKDIIENSIKDTDKQYQRLQLIRNVFNKLNYYAHDHDISNPVYQSIHSVIGSYSRIKTKLPYIYCYETQREHHEDILPIYISPQECFTEDSLVNNGFGAKIMNGIYQTSQYSLEIIWHQKIMNYPFLTSSIQKADIAFIPFYTFLSSWKMKRYVYSYRQTVSTLNRLLPEWNKRNIPHILVFSDVMWNDSRVYNHHVNMPDNLTTITLESIPTNRFNNKLLTVPYPTEFHCEINGINMSYFHKTDRQVLVSYIGRSRFPVPQLSKYTEFKSHILIEPDKFWKSTNNIEFTTRLIYIYGNSVFSLHPHGDRGTRRGFYQSLFFGCIPVVFESNFNEYNSLYNGLIDISRIAVVIPLKNIQQTIQILQKINVHQYRTNIAIYIRKLQYSNYNDPEDAFSTVIKSL